MEYIAYYRVSTQKQGMSGLGLAAQRTTVLNYIQRNGNRLIAEYTEVESGKRNNRPILLQALDHCKQENATLVIARLDRLSRNVNFITALMESKVRFVCCDMPEATEFTIHIFAALAQQQQRYISERTREGIAAKRRREPQWQPGTNNITSEIRQRAWQANRLRATVSRENRHAYHFIKPLREQGKSYQQIAGMLNAEGYRTVTGKPFQAMQVYNIMRRFASH